MLPNVELSLVPMPFTAAMITTEMPAAIRPYSMAVAAVSSLRKHYMKFFTAKSFWSRTGAPQPHIVIDWSITIDRLYYFNNKYIIMACYCVITSNR
jgi:hypothetical protein